MIDLILLSREAPKSSAWWSMKRVEHHEISGSTPTPTSTEANLPDDFPICPKLGGQSYPVSLMVGGSNPGIGHIDLVTNNISSFSSWPGHHGYQKKSLLHLEL